MRKARVIGYRKPHHKIVNKQGGLDALYTNGANNLYPNYVRDSISGSPTASRAHSMNTDYIVGELAEEDFIINDSEELYLSNLLHSSASDLSAQGGFYIHVNIGWRDGTYYHTNPSIIPYENCRLNKADDRDRTSKVFVSKEFTENVALRTSVKEMDWYYRYTNKQSAIEYQIKDWAKEKGIDISTGEGMLEAIKSFKGQIRYVKYTNEFPYVTSPVDSILVDAESEFYISKYTNEQTVNGFLGKTIAFVVEDDESGDSEYGDDETLENWLGTDGSGGVFIQPMRNTDDPSKLIHIETVKGNFDDKMFEVTQTRLRRNILGLFDNLPESLVFSGDGSLFGQHPDLFENLIKFYKGNTRKKRLFLYKILSDTLGIEIELKEDWK